MAQQNVREIISDIQKGRFNPVYILMGEEAYFIDLIVQNIEKYAVDEADRDFNSNIFYGNDADIDYVMGAAQQFPVMAPRKLVMLKEAQSMVKAKTELERLAPYISRPNQSTIFVVIYKGDSFTATSKIMKAAKESDAVVFKSAMVKDWQLPAQIKDYCAMRKVSIEEKAVQLLCDYIGNPLSKLFGEVNKLISIAGGKGARITCDDIEKNIGISKDFNNFELLNAIGEKNYPKAIQIVNYFRNNPKTNPTVVTTGMIINFFMNLIIAHYLPDKSDQSIMTALNFKYPKQVSNIRVAMRNYTAMQTVNAIHHIREFDIHSKGIESQQNEYDLLQELIFKMFT